MSNKFQMGIQTVVGNNGVRKVVVGVELILVGEYNSSADVEYSYLRAAWISDAGEKFVSGKVRPIPVHFQFVYTFSGMCHPKVSVIIKFHVSRIAVKVA